MYRPRAKGGAGGALPAGGAADTSRAAVPAPTRGDVQIQTSTAEGSSGRELFTPGFGRRLLTRLALILVYVAAAVPAGLFRGFADNFGLPVHTHFNAFEQVLFWDGTSRWLQAAFLDIRPLQYAAVYVYASWFFLPIVATLPLFSDGSRSYWRLIGFLMLTYYAGMPFFALYPLQPPWMHDGSVQHVLALVNPGIAGRDDNPYAAMPSLHVALPAAAACWYGWRERAGQVLFAYSALIAVTVMYTGDHYIADIAAGYALAGCVLFAVRRLGWPLLRTNSAPAAEPTASPAPALDQRPRAAA
jgi:PAP2 superfamily protein